jgi:hypothetical protein
MVAILVTGCYGKSMVAMKMHMFLWKVSGCFGKSLVAMGTRRLLRKSLVAMKS